MPVLADDFESPTTNHAAKRLGGRRWRLPFVACFVTVVGATGCGSSDRVSVTGRVTRHDGSPVVRCRVTFRSPETGNWASGVTDSDGYYVLGTEEKDEGIPPGEYTVSVTEDLGDWDNPSPPTIHGKYASPKTSGLSYTIKAGSDDTFDFELETPQGA